VGGSSEAFKVTSCFLAEDLAEDLAGRSAINIAYCRVQGNFCEAVSKQTVTTISQMIPRFQNPHSSVLSSTYTTRAQIFCSHEIEEGTSVVNEFLLQKLEELVRESLGDLHPVEQPRRKRKKIGKEYRDGFGSNDALSQCERPARFHRCVSDVEMLAFRLVSNSLPPSIVSLSPKPLPPSKCVVFQCHLLLDSIFPYRIREPPCEDTDVEAEQRMERARSVAVDLGWVLQQSKNQPQLVNLFFLLSTRGFTFGSPYGADVINRRSKLYRRSFLIFQPQLPYCFWLLNLNNRELFDHLPSCLVF